MHAGTSLRRAKFYKPLWSCHWHDHAPKPYNFSMGLCLKLDKWQLIVLCIVIVGSMLDYATTEKLLSVGQLQRGDLIYIFSESNPLFHQLGADSFKAAYALITLLIMMLVVAEPHLTQGKRSLHSIAMATLALYGFAHLILGLHNLAVIIAFGLI